MDMKITNESIIMKNLNINRDIRPTQVMKNPFNYNYEEEARILTPNKSFIDSNIKKICNTPQG